MAFKKAVKYNARARVAIIAPAGGGKSMTMLKLARALAGPAGRIAAIDTEHGSLSKYAPTEGQTANNETSFDFDVQELGSFSPESFQTALKDAEEAKYDVFCVDSLSHFWIGKDGALEFVDMAAKRHRDQMGGWKEFRPHEREMVDRMIASPCHVIVTMRTKTDYQEVTDSNGKKKRVKIGLAPVQREGLEFEFDMVGYMDPEDNTFVVDKSRCSLYAQKAYTKPGQAEFQPFIDWLTGTERRLPDTEQAGHLSAIEKAADMEVLRKAFVEAWRAAERIGDAATMTSLQAAKEKRKKELTPQEKAA